MTFRLFLFTFVSLAAVLVIPTPGALGASYVVDTADDDATVAKTACTAAADDCSLRGAITNANALSTPGDVITFDPTVFPSGTPATITLSTILPLMSGGGDTLDGTGAGVILDATGEAPTFTCLSVPSAGNTIKGLQFTDCTNGISLGAPASDNNVLGPGNVYFDNTRGVLIVNAGASGNKVIGSMFGTNAAGTAVHPDGANTIGIQISGSPNNTIGGTTSNERNVISSNTTGIVLITSATGNRVIGNHIGTDAAGTADLGNGKGISIESSSSNTIGGSVPGESNLISGNAASNIEISQFSSSNNIVGNVVGPNVNGSGAAMISGVGVYLRSGASNNIVGPGNVISDNSAGVSMTESITQGNIVKGNVIGTDAAGTSGVPNSTGVEMFDGASNNTVGGAAPGDGNIIAFNTGFGTSVIGATSTGNSIRGNSVFSNGIAQIDNSVGGNTELLPPTLNSTLYGTASGFACPNCEVDVFSDNGTHARFYEGSTTAAGDGSFTFVSDAPFVGANATATNTDAAGNTSELATHVVIDSDDDGTADGADGDDDNDGVVDTSDACRVLPEDFDGFEDTNGCPDPDNDLDGVLDGADSGQLCFDPAGTLSCAVQGCQNIAEDYDAFKDTDGCPEPDNDNDAFPDATDECPGSDAVAGADGMLGSPQDLNHNGVQDGAETTLTSDDSVLTFEDDDGVLDGDGCHDSPGEDFDGDGFTDDAEAGMLLCLNALNDDAPDDAVANDGCPGGPPQAGAFSEAQISLGTNAGYPCGFNSWPADLWDQPPLSANKITVQDLTAFLAPAYRLNTSPGHPNFNARWDLYPGKGIFANTINAQDLTVLVTLFPPMLNGARALNGPVCPHPSQ